ncbi:MAG TPA: amino acid permease [Myxococcales bacterium]|nr:amino acid permease [Myxococcales bacterium]
MAGLRRALGALDATMVNVGVMIGSAVFLVASDVARSLPDPLLQLGAWVVAALFSLAGALTIAELGAAMPEAGGLYVYLRRAFGPFWGFLYGWSLFAVIQTAAIAAVAVAFASYCGHFVPLSAGGIQLVATTAIVFFTCLNILGIREGVVTQNIVTFAKIAVVLGVVVLAFVGGAGSWSNLAAPPSDRPIGLVAVAASLIGPLAAYDGWITISYMGGEVKRPERNLPIAALASVAIVAALYLALNAAYLIVLGPGRVAASQLVASDTARALIGARGADLAAAMVIIATVGGLHGNILAGARVLYAMAAEGLFWRPAAQVHPRLQTPAVALAAQGVVSVAFVFTGRFDQLLTSFLFASWLFYGLGGLAVFVLRRDPALQRPYRVPGYPIVPALFVLFAALLLVGTIAADPRDSLLGGALLLTGVPAYLLFASASRRTIQQRE